jgi:DNA-binding NarL/FixJ family response regulator
VGGAVSVSVKVQRDLLAEYLKLIGWKLSGPAMPHMPQRHRQALRLLLVGKSEKEIARSMGVSLHTVHDYVKSIHRALGVSSRAELMARFLPSATGLYE